MSETDDVTKRVSPKAVLEQIASDIPQDCRENMIIIGSLAAGYQLFSGDDELMVRTKDADCLLSPRINAIPAGKAIAERLFEENWTFRSTEERPGPGNADTPEQDLPAVRLNPPGNSDWFIELLTVPETPSDQKPEWPRLHTSRGDFVLPCFKFQALSNFEPILTPLGIYVARPELLALANLLEHPEIKPGTMSGLIGGREIKRSNKDLGRVLAIARLSIRKDEDSLLAWPGQWVKALQARFPDDWRELALRAGAGLRQLLSQPNDLEEAHHTCVYGLLASMSPTLEQLRRVGHRLLTDVFEPFEASARSSR